MTIELVPLTLPESADASNFADFGRQVKNVDPGALSPEQFKEIEQALYTVRNIIPQIPNRTLMFRSLRSTMLSYFVVLI